MSTVDHILHPTKEDHVAGYEKQIRHFEERIKDCREAIARLKAVPPGGQKTLEE